MRITVNLDTQAVTTTPSPLRLKAASIAPIEAAFTRGSAAVPLPPGAVIEFGLKAKGKTDTDLLVYSNEFAAVAGTLYAANVNCATVPIEAALGIADDDPSNDLPFIELSAELGWTIGDLHFRSQTFSVFVDAPVISSGAPALYLPPRYPVLDGNILHFVRGDGTLASVPVSGQGVTLPNPVNANVAYLGNGTWGLPNLAGYTGNIGNTEVHAGSIYATLFGNVGSETEMTANIYGNHFGDGSGLAVLNPNALNASSWNGRAIGSNDSPLDTITAWHFVGRGSPCFEGDGSGLTNLPGFDIAGAAILANSANFFLNEFFANQTGGDIGFSNQPYNTVYANCFVGDGSGLWNLSGSGDLSNYSGNIGQSYAPMGAIYATTISGDGGAGLTAAYAYTSGGASAGMADFNAFFSPTTNWTTMNLGGEGSPLGTVYANYFVGDGSGLTNLPGGGGGGSTNSDFDTFFTEAMGTTYGGMNLGVHPTPLNGVHANSFFGDGSNLTFGENIARIAGSYPWIVKAIYNGQEQDVRVADADHAGYADYSGNASWADGCQSAGVANTAMAPTSDLNGFFANYNWPAGNMNIGSVEYPMGNIYGTAFFGDGSGLTNVGGGTPDLTSYTGNIGGVWSPVGNIYTTCIGDSDHWIPNIFSTNIEAGTIWADQYFVCYTGIALPSPAPCGTICYSRHAGGHFYGMTDDGWKQLDS